MSLGLARTGTLCVSFLFLLETPEITYEEGSFLLVCVFGGLKPWSLDARGFESSVMVEVLTSWWPGNRNRKHSAPQQLLQGTPQEPHFLLLALVSLPLASLPPSSLIGCEQDFNIGTFVRDI